MGWRSSLGDQMVNHLSRFLLFVTRYRLQSLLCSSDEESYTSSLTCPEPNVVVSRVTVLHWTGFFHKEQVKMLIQLLLPLHKPWVNLTLHSFDDDCTSGTLCRNAAMITIPLKLRYLILTDGLQLSSICLSSSGDHHILTCRSPTNKVK